MNVRKQIIGSAAAVTVAVSFSAASITPAAFKDLSSNVVRTLNCLTNPVTAAADAGVQIAVSATKVSIETGDPGSPEKFLGFKSNGSGYTVGGRCRAVSKHVVMTLNRLTSSTHASAIDCAAPAHVWMRFALKFDSDGSPVSGKVEITQPHARLKPLAQVQWSRGQPPLTYYGIACAERK